MAIIKAKPTSPGRRGVISIKTDLHKGKPEKSLYHFKKALELTENKYLLARLIFAKTYAVQNQNRELFEVQLQAILQAPNDLFPEQELANQVARKKATKLLERIDELF